MESTRIIHVLMRSRSLTVSVIRLAVPHSTISHRRMYSPNSAFDGHPIFSPPSQQQTQPQPQDVASQSERDEPLSSLVNDAGVADAVMNLASPLRPGPSRIRLRLPRPRRQRVLRVVFELGWLAG
jgi:hypothetical protein